MTLLTGVFTRLRNNVRSPRSASSAAPSDPSQPEGLALSPDGSDLYMGTNRAIIDIDDAADRHDSRPAAKAAGLCFSQPVYGKISNSEI